MARLILICALVVSSFCLQQQDQQQLPLFQDVPNSDDVSSLINSIQNGSPKSRIFYDYQTRIVAYKDLIKSRCLLEFLKSSETLIKQNVTDTNSIAKDFFVSDRPLSKRQIWMLAGQRLYEFCRGFPTYLLQEVNSTSYTINNDIVEEETIPVKKTITKRETKHFFVGRVRGQTQSQYLNYGNSNDPGKAEAESSYGSSKAVVTGNSGMGQAQSQSSPVGCDECYGSETDQYRRPSAAVGHNGQVTAPGYPGQLRRPGLSEGTLQAIPGHPPQSGQPLPPGQIPGQLRRPGLTEGTLQAIPGHPPQPGQALPPGQIPGQSTPSIYPSIQSPGQLIYPNGQIPGGQTAYTPRQPGYPGQFVQTSDGQVIRPQPSEPPGQVLVQPGYPGQQRPVQTPGVQIVGQQPSGPPGQVFFRPSYPGEQRPIQVPGAQIGGQQPSGHPGQVITQPGYPGQQIPGVQITGQVPGYTGVPVGYPGTELSRQPGGTGVQIPVQIDRGAQQPGIQLPSAPGVQIPSKPQYPVGPGITQGPGQIVYPSQPTGQIPGKTEQVTFPVQPGTGQYPGQQRPTGGKFSGQFSGDYNQQTERGGKFSGTFAGDYAAYENGRVTGTVGGVPGVSTRPSATTIGGGMLVKPGQSGYTSGAVEQGYPGYTYEQPGATVVSQPSRYVQPGRDGQIMLSPGVFSVTNGQPGHVTGAGQPGYIIQSGTTQPGYISAPGQTGYVGGQQGPNIGDGSSGYVAGQPGYISSGTPGHLGQIPVGVGTGQSSYTPSEVAGQTGYIPGQTPGQSRYISNGAPEQQGYISGTPGQLGYIPGAIPGQPSYISGGQPAYPTGSAGQPGYVPGQGTQTNYGAGQPGYVLGPGGQVISGAGVPGQGAQTNQETGQPGYVLGPGGQLIPGSAKPAEYVRPPGAVQGGYIDQYGRFVSTAGEQTDDSDSQAETSVQQNNNETQVSASSQGKYGGGTAQSQVSGTYSGSGSFSASAGSDDGSRGALTQISGGKEGAQSSAQGRGGLGQSQAQVQLNSDTGDTMSNAQSGGFNHGTQTQVQASGKGGMADAQANGPGSTSSQAQIGFSPYDEQDVDDQQTPFRGGGMASAQSSALSGQTQTQIQGKFHHGIKYIGAAQAGSGNIQTSGIRNQTQPSRLNAFKPITFRPSQSQTQQVSKTDSSTSHSSKLFQMTQDQLEPLTQRTTNESDIYNRTPKHMASVVETTPESVPINSSIAAQIDKDEDDYNDENAYDDYDTDDQTERRTDRAIITQKTENQQQQIALDPLEDLDATVQQSYGDTVLDDTILQPGESVPGSPGYQIPPGFRGRVKSIASGRNTYTSGRNSQAQSVTLTPGSGKIVYKRPVYSVGSRTQNINGRYGYGSGYTYQPVRYQLKSGRSLPNFISVTKSETGSRNLYTGKKTPSVYYAQSSTCGVFTNTCVFNASGRVCFPKPKTNPDGTLMGC